MFKVIMYVFWLIVYAVMALSSTYISPYPLWAASIVFIVWFLPTIGPLLVYGWCAWTVYHSIQYPISIVTIAFYVSLGLMIAQDIGALIIAKKVEKYEKAVETLAQLEMLSNLSSYDDSENK